VLTYLGDIELPNKKTYAKYTFYRELFDNRTEDDEDAVNENDCLKFAESITSFVNLHQNPDILNKQLQQDTGPTVLQYKDVLLDKPTNRRPKRASTVKSTSPKSPKSFHFGDSDLKNQTLLKCIPPEKINDNAIPNQGELYAIVRTRSTSNRSSYHIAYVIYSDDTINITIEAEADNETQYQPKFCLYDKNPDGNTFHRRWTGELYRDSDRVDQLYKNSRTVVLTMQPEIGTIEALFDKDIIPSGFRIPVTMPSLLLHRHSPPKGTLRKSSSKNPKESSNSAKQKRQTRSKEPSLL
jgi:hypothetical protein